MHGYLKGLRYFFSAIFVTVTSYAQSPFLVGFVVQSFSAVCLQMHNQFSKENKCPFSLISNDFVKAKEKVKCSFVDTSSYKGLNDTLRSHFLKCFWGCVLFWGVKRYLFFALLYIKQCYYAQATHALLDFSWKWRIHLRKYWCQYLIGCFNK